MKIFSVNEIKFPTDFYIAKNYNGLINNLLKIKNLFIIN
jgi:hypothetical protein